MALAVLKIKNKKEFQHTTEHLMFNLRQRGQHTAYNIPADGLWHACETSLTPTNMNCLRMRRQQETPDILDVQMQTQNNPSIINMKIRVGH
jgi:hypothetical protein